MRNIQKILQQTVTMRSICSLFAVSVLATCSWAQELVPQGEQDIVSDQNSDAYSYLVEGRTDPFRPFISPKAALPPGLDPNEIVDEQVELTGLQLFEPGQLTLVGILRGKSSDMALVEDQTKKGYIVKQGVPLGRRGVVSQIDNQQVVITETSRTRAGKEINNTVIMRLNKEGDK